MTVNKIIGKGLYRLVLRAGTARGLMMLRRLAFTVVNSRPGTAAGKADR